MKALRILAFGLAAILALVAAAAVALYALFDGERIGAEAVRAVQERTGRTLVIAAPPELSLWPEIGLRVGRLTLSEPGGGGEFLALDSARVAVAVMPLLSRQVQVRRLDVVGLKATVVKRKDGHLSIADLAAVWPAPAKVGAGQTAAAPLRLEIEGIRVAGAQLVWRDEAGGRGAQLANLDFGTGRLRADGDARTLDIEALTLAARGKSGGDAFELTLDAPRLALSPHAARGDTVRLAAKLAGAGRDAALRLTATAVDGDAQAMNIGNLALELDARAGETKLAARLASPVAAELATRRLALEKLAGNLDLAHPRLPMKSLALPLSGSLRADLARQSAALDLAARFDDTKVAAKLELTRLAPLAASFELDIDRLDLDRYLPPRGKEEAPAAAERTLDFSALRGPEAKGAVRIGALRVAKVKLSTIDARIRLAGGRLDLAPLSLDLYGGTARGALSLDAGSNAILIKETLADADIGALLRDFADRDLIEGRGGLALDITSRGESVTAMKKALAGSASLRLRDGALKGINLAQSLREIKGKLGARQDETRAAAAGEKTDFSELAASFRIAGGIARNDDLAAKSPFLRLAGSGDIDIGNGRMDYLARASVVASGAGQGGKELDQLKGLTLPVRIAGPFDRLSFRPELGGLIEGAARAGVEARKEEVKARVEEKARDKLKGLLGR